MLYYPTPAISIVCVDFACNYGYAAVKLIIWRVGLWYMKEWQEDYHRSILQII